MNPVPALALPLFLGCLCGCASLIDAFAGASSREPGEMEGALSAEARALLGRAYEGIDRARMADYHTHIVGTGEGGSGCYVNSRMLSWWHVTDRVRFLAYKSAGRIEDEARAESQYVDRLVALARPLGGRLGVLAFDQRHRADGTADRDRTEFHVPNDHAFAVAAAHPDLFAAVCSVHPYRADALDELSRCAARGARICKWLPNAMGIDPADPRCAPFYERMRDLGMALLSHGGKEAAVHADEDQKLGNPQRLRAALERGVKVIVAHCAGLGEDEDLDDPARPHVPSWRHFLRMMDDPRWDGLLYGELSATTQANRTPEPLRTLLLRGDLHARFVNGSDYPLPAVNVVIRTSKFESLGWITAAEKAALDELYDFDPLVFDFALKRTLRVKDESGAEHRFAPSCFEEHPALPLGGAAGR